MPEEREPTVDTPALAEQPDAGPLSPGDTGRTGLVVTDDEDGPEEGRRERSRAASPLPEEQVAGAENATERAEAVLRDSDERQASREAAPAAVVEHRTSDEATAPSE